MWAGLRKRGQKFPTSDNRKIGVHGSKVLVALETRGRFGKEDKDRLKSLGVDFSTQPHALGHSAYLPFAAIKQVSKSTGVVFARPVLLPEEVERLEVERKIWERDRRKIVKKVGKWYSPVSKMETDIIVGELMMGFSFGYDPKRAEEILRTYGCWVTRNAPEPRDAWYGVRCRQDIDMQTLLDWLGHDPEVQFLEPNGPIEPLQLVPNDPLFSAQWNLQNLGTAQQGGGKPDADIDAPEGWARSTGSAGVVIAVIDTGVELTHEDLKNKLRVGPDIPGNGFDEDANGFVDDAHGWNFGENNAVPDDWATFANGHGTLVAGIAAAETNNGIGIAGVNWSARIMPIRISDRSQMPDAIKYAYRNGAKVINISFGAGYEIIQIIETQLFAAAASGVTIVAASGNDGVDRVKYPASSLNVIAVGATDKRDDRAPYSNTGIALSMVAPGDHVWSTARFNDYVDSEIGTSLAAPHVAGAAAILLSLRPELPWYEVRKILETNSDDLDLPGWDIRTGFGRLNLDRVLRAVQQAAPPPPPPPIEPFRVAGSTAIDNRYVDVRFNMSLDSFTAVHAANYALNPALGLEGIVLLADGMSVRLRTSTQTAQTPYALMVAGVKNAGGTAIAAPNNTASFTGIGPSGGESFLWRVSATADETPGTRLAIPGGGSASFSPDGGRAAYVKDVGPLDSGGARFFLFRSLADGSQETRLIPEDSDRNHSDADPDWSPLQDKIAFSGIRTIVSGSLTSITENIHVVNADGSGLFRLTAPGVLVSERYPAWSPDGSRIAFVEGDGNIMVMDAGGSNRALLNASAARRSNLSWHPDGARIAFEEGPNVLLWASDLPKDIMDGAWHGQGAGNAWKALPNAAVEVSTWGPGEHGITMASATGRLKREFATWAQHTEVR